MKGRLALGFVGLVLVSGAVLFTGVPLATASDDHERARMLRDAGEIVPLSAILQRPELGDARVLEADLEREDGRMVYELEVLDPDGRVREWYFDAATGEPLSWEYEDAWKR
jgi:hypothetical protein